MVAVSLQVSIAYGLIVSGALVWLNRAGRGPLAGALVSVAICLAIGFFQLRPGNSGDARVPLFRLWMMSALIPSAAVFAASVLPFVRVRSWGFLLIGPLSFLIGMVVAMTVFNNLSGPRPGG